MEMLMIYPVFIGIAAVTAQLAHYRGYSARWWFLMGILLPIISLFMVFALKKKEKPMSGMYEPVDKTIKDKVLFTRSDDKASPMA